MQQLPAESMVLCIHDLFKAQQGGQSDRKNTKPILAMERTSFSW